MNNLSLLELFKYNHHTNKQLINICEQYRSKIGSTTILLFSHILNAQYIWNKRILNEMPKYSTWQTQPLSQWNEFDENNQTTTNSIINRLPLEKEISYKNTKDKIFKNSIQHILFHVVNHSTYHRAQIAIDFKNNNLTPLITDYIAYKR